MIVDRYFLFQSALRPVRKQLHKQRIQKAVAWQMLFGFFYYFG